MNAPAADPIRDLLQRLDGVKQTGDGRWSARCPAHEDRRASLSVSRGDGGKALVKCFAGCTIEDICAKLNIATYDLSPSRIVETYPYCDESGRLLYECVRFEPKDFRQRQPDGAGKWHWKMNGVQRVLYHLPELLNAFDERGDEFVFVVEGEKDVDRLLREGLIATCNVGGAGKWKHEYSKTLRGRRVCIIADKDDAGRKHAAQVAQALQGIAQEVRVIECDRGKKDAFDYFADGGTADELLKLADNAATWTPTNDFAEPAAPEPVQHEPVDTSPAWPAPLADEAYYGLAGEIVRKIEPHTEADPAALLIHLLVACGNIFGRTAYFSADGAQHFPNLFAVTVGETSKGRKGTASRQIERLLKTVSPDWVDNHNVEGLSSGEGLIWAVRDRIIQRQPIKEKGRVVDYEDVETDPGIADKRLLVGESEFAGTLKVAQRETNTLSPVVRRAWDTGTLRTLTKNTPATATGAHISIIGHITKDELRRTLDTTETANGFCNRFLWVCVRRSKCLPEGGAIHTVDFGHEVRSLESVFEWAKEDGGPFLIPRDAEARDLWGEVYPELSAGRAGLLGAVVSRAEAQVMRLALVYAMLDKLRFVRVPHLRAALALWSYCDASARYIFGTSMGDRNADELLHALRASSEGLSRKQIAVDVFNKHRTSEQIERACTSLAQAGLARRETRTDTGGRPEERWFAVTAPANKANKANKGSGDSSLSSLSSPVPDDYERLEREAMQTGGM